MRNIPIERSGVFGKSFVPVQNFGKGWFPSAARRPQEESSVFQEIPDFSVRFHEFLYQDAGPDHDFMVARMVVCVVPDHMSQLLEPSDNIAAFSHVFTYNEKRCAHALVLQEFRDLNCSRTWSVIIGERESLTGRIKTNRDG